MSRALRSVLSIVALAAFAAPGRVHADYDSHPELRPAQRCSGLEDPASKSGYNPDCQPLFWSLPAATRVGQTAVAAPDPVWGFPNGMVDRPPPLYTDGVNGFERPGTGRTRLCSNIDMIPYWKPTGKLQEYEVACARGTRAYFGPFAIGSNPTKFDDVVVKFVTFENSARLTRDGLATGHRREWNTSSEMYTHYASHHATCDLSTHHCSDANDPAYAGSAACADYHRVADQCPAESPGRECHADLTEFTAFRASAARQGRSATDIPSGRAFGVVEDPIWACNQHVINDEPAGYGSRRRRDFRKQQGGAMGEMVLQFFTAPYSAPYKPVSLAFDFVVSNLTTYVPPFAVAPQDTIWYAPFDLAIGMLSMHSHENMVRGTIDVLPAHAPRMGSSDAQCGGGSGASPPLHAYENTSYFEPKVCEYWRESDGPLILRKGQAIRASCLINNGVNQTSQIDDPAVRQAVEGGPLGDALYAGRDSSEFRVRYGCEDIEGVPPGSPHVIPPVAGLGGTPRDCPPNPAKDAAGRPVDGAYDAPQYCPPNLGYTGRCVPAGLVFANTATDTMCIPIIMYWPLDRILNADGSVDEGAMQHLQDGDVNEVGTPGRVWKSPSDTGSCDDGAGDGGVNVAQPVELSKGGRRCRAGL